jgi:hypothetical protein
MPSEIFKNPRKYRGAANMRRQKLPTIAATVLHGVIRVNLWQNRIHD